MIKKIINRVKGLAKKEIIINKGNQGSINFIDVGSIGGLPDPWKDCPEQISNALFFEPLEETQRKGNIIKYNTALWSHSTELDFYIYKGLKGTGSSLFQQNFKYVDEHFEELKQIGNQRLAESWHQRSQLVRTEKLKCRSLDEVIEDVKVPFNYDFLKIDAQGAEFEILNGAKNFLSESCLGLHLELFKIPMYKGIKLIDEVIEYLSQYNFEEYKRYPAHGTFLSQHDVVFLKKDVENPKVQLIRSIYS